MLRYCDGIMIRTFAQEEVETLAAHANIPVINGLTDFCHPCQVLADLMTVREHKAVLKGLKMCYIGDGNNMANSLIVGGLKVGMEVSVACPEGYEPHPDVLAFAKSDPEFKFTLCRDPKEAAVNADVVFTRRVGLHGPGGGEGHPGEGLRGLSGEPRADGSHQPRLYGAALPARPPGEEITADVFEEHAEEIFDEAENRLHAQKAVMYLLMGGETDPAPPNNSACRARSSELPEPARVLCPGGSGEAFGETARRNSRILCRNLPFLNVEGGVKGNRLW